MDTETAIAVEAEASVERAEVIEGALTERVETEAEVAEAAIEASVEIAQINADAAVAIAEAEAVQEIDIQWLASQFEGVHTSLANLSLLLTQVQENQATLAAAMIAPSIPTLPLEPLETAAIPETLPVAEGGLPAVETPERRRIRRLM